MAQGHQQDWDRYWRHAGGVPVFGQFTRNSQILRDFWSEFFSQTLADFSRTCVLDMACGSGAVTTASLQVAERLGRSDVDHFCLDYSVSAVSALRRRAPRVKPIASDVGAAAYADGAFGVVASQFGLEYAGPAAFVEAARLVAPDGVFCALCHFDGGAVHEECLDNLDTIETVLNCRIMPLAKSAFSALFALDRGTGSAPVAEEAHKALAAATKTMRELIEEKGPQAANGTPGRLLQDVTHMYNRRRNYLPKAVFDWIDVMTEEVTAYAGRMKAMSEAALDEAAIRDIREALISAGLRADDTSLLRLGSSADPGAWIIKAAR